MQNNTLRFISASSSALEEPDRATAAERAELGSAASADMARREGSSFSQPARLLGSHHATSSLGFRLWHLKGRSALGVTRRNGLRYSDAITLERFVPVSCDCSRPQTVAELMQVSFAS